MKTKLPSLTAVILVLAVFIWWHQYGHRMLGLTAAEPSAESTANGVGGDQQVTPSAEAASSGGGPRVGQQEPPAAVRPPLSEAPPPAADTTAVPVLDGQRLITAAARRVSRCPSMAAKLRLTIDMFGQRLTGSGNYLQLGQGEDKLLRLEMTIQTDEHALVSQQIADGRFLWMRRELGNTVSLGRVDLKRLRSELAAHAAPNNPVDNSAWMALGGLAKLLVSLDKNFHFSAAEQGRVAQQQMLAVEGSWKPDRLAELIGENVPSSATQPGRAQPGQLPPQVPHRVVVLLGRDNLFPYRVEYLQEEQGGEAKPAAGPAARRTKVINRLEFYEVEVPATIDPLRFVYKPDATQIEDRTQAMIDALIGSSGQGPQ